MKVQIPYRFQFQVSGLNEAKEDMLVEAIEAYFSEHNGTQYVTILQPGSSLMQAARASVACLRDHHLEVERLEPDFVTRTDIAERAGVSRQTVNNWVNGHRQANFPRQAISLSGGIWYWPDVETWLQATGKTLEIEELHPTLRECDRINVMLHDLTEISETGRHKKRMSAS